VDVSEHPIRIVVREDDLSRERLTVFFRWLLAIPHFLWLGLWSVAIVFAWIANWLATLVLGRSPRPLHGFLAAYVKCITQFFAWLNLAADPYPPFSGRPGYVVDLTIEPPARQSRWSVGFRAILILPALLLVGAFVGDPTFSGNNSGSSFGGGVGLLHVAAILGWFAIMARGSMPRGLRDATLYALSYGAQFWSYAFLLTDRYPSSDPLAALAELPAREDPISLELHDELRRSRLTVFFRLLLAIPHLVWLALWQILALLVVIVSWFATLFTGRTPERLHGFLAAFLRYQFHVYAFLYLIANPFPGFVGAVGSYPLEIEVAQRARQNRWKTGFRVILVIPALLLAGAYGSLVTLAAVLGWFVGLLTARMPRGLRNAGALALRYHAQTLGYLLLLSDSYPYGGPTASASPADSEPPPAPALSEGGAAPQPGPS
jgi:Domain of unknown function (DUF4389)